MEPIAKINDKQKDVIYHIGFGAVFHIKMKEILAKLTYSCVDHFRPQSCSLEIVDGKRLHITDENVW